MRRWRPRLEGINFGPRQFGVGVRGEGGPGSLTHPIAPRGEQFADFLGLLLRLQRGQTDGGARGGGHLRAGTHTLTPFVAKLLR